MDAKKIESASLLDLVFEGRNKEYGAYELRTGYNKRLRNALLLTTLIALLLLTASFISSLDLGGKKRPGYHQGSAIGGNQAGRPT